MSKTRYVLLFVGVVLTFGGLILTPATDYSACMAAFLGDDSLVCLNWKALGSGVFLLMSVLGSVILAMAIVEFLHNPSKSEETSEEGFQKPTIPREFVRDEGDSQLDSPKRDGEKAEFDDTPSRYMDVGGVRKTVSCDCSGECDCSGGEDESVEESS